MANKLVTQTSYNVINVNSDYWWPFIKQCNKFCHNYVNKLCQIVGYKPKGWISKRVFRENKTCQIFRKTNISRTCAYQRVRNVRFSENLTCFVFLKHPFWDLPFCLITNEISWWKFWWKIVSSFWPLTIFTKRPIRDLWKSPKYVNDVLKFVKQRASQGWKFFLRIQT